MHASVLGQVCPQEPQLLLSDCKLAHTDPHSVSDEEQLTAASGVALTAPEGGSLSLPPAETAVTI